MIHIFIGTKAQYVKTAPVLKELEKRGIIYNLIDSGQHAAISKNFRKYFNIKDPDVCLVNSKNDIVSIPQLLRWLTAVLFKTFLFPQKIFVDVFKSKKGICVIHGDTPTTLLSMILAKRCGIKVAHLESGLRSYNIFNPFPEEIIRIITMRFTDYLFAPTKWAQENLIKMKVKGKIYFTGGNTNIDALRLVINNTSTMPEGINRKDKYAVFSIHRAETILIKNRFIKIIELLKKVSLNTKVLFCIHPPTKKRLQNLGFDRIISELSNIKTSDLLPYPLFVQALKNAYFIVTDGGSVQEESYYLNVPCLLMRYSTERVEGLGENALLSIFDDNKINEFLNNVNRYKISGFKETDVSPSKEIVDIILNLKEVQL